MLRKRELLDQVVPVPWKEDVEGVNVRARGSNVHEKGGNTGLPPL